MKPLLIFVVTLLVAAPLVASSQDQNSGTDTSGSVMDRNSPGTVPSPGMEPAQRPWGSEMPGTVGPDMGYGYSDGMRNGMYGPGSGTSDSTNGR